MTAGALTSLIISGRASLFVDFAIFHYELDIFEQANICERIAWDGDDVGVLAGIERTDFAGVSE